jgi:hypothetical protein
MRNRPCSELEIKLRQSYTQEIDLYQQALEVAERLQLAYRENSANGESVLQELLMILDQIACIDQDSILIRELWKNSGYSAGPELQQVLNMVAELIQKLAERIAAAEATLQEQKARLAPELDAVNRVQQAQRSYGRVLEQSALEN